MCLQHLPMGYCVLWSRNALSYAIGIAKEVDDQVFSKYDVSQIHANKLDKKSIMMYPVPEALSKGDFRIGWNNGLSDVDKKFIAKLYPRK